MERKLFIIRHGKSSWENERLDDIDRPLTKRGKNNAEMMASRLLLLEMVPELIYTSPARRARDTASIMHETWDLVPSILKVREKLYMTDADEIADIVGGAPDRIQNLAIFGHNPAFTQYANTFLDDPLENLPTAGVVVLTLDCDSWKGISIDQVIDTHVDFPKKDG